MIQQKIHTGSEQMTLRIKVSTTSEQVIHVMVQDSTHENTVLTDRFATVNGKYNFDIPLVLCKKFVQVFIWCDESPQDDSCFTYEGYDKLALETRFNVIDFKTKNLNEYIRFVHNFCYTAGFIPTNDPNNTKDYYRSSNWNFFIKYLPVITDYESGDELVTPARISVDAPIIEVSQKYFKDYTVPMREATLYHEYSHPFVNSDADNESEADVNGLLIYKGLGFSSVEASECWAQILDDNPTPENEQRWEVIKQLLTDFENKKIVFKRK